MTFAVFFSKLRFVLSQGISMKRIIMLVTAGLLSASAVAAQDINSEHAQKTLEIYTRIIEVESSKNLGNVPEIANYLASELANLIVRTSWLSPSRAKYSHCMGIITPSAAESAFIVSNPSEGGQSMNT